MNRELHQPEFAPRAIALAGFIGVGGIRTSFRIAVSGGR